jgi:hypothetical protein
VSIKARLIYVAVASLLTLLGIGATDPQKFITFIINIGSPNSTTTVNSSPTNNDSKSTKTVAEQQSDDDFDIRIIDGVNK